MQEGLVAMSIVTLHDRQIFILILDYIDGKDIHPFYLINVCSA